MQSKYTSAFSHGFKYIERQLGTRFPAIGLHAQFQLYLELSMRCNMKCSYCDLWNQDHSVEVDPELWKTVLTDLLDVLGQPKINIAVGQYLGIANGSS